MDQFFLLKNDLARRLYHECAATLPIIDYHNHLSVSDIAQNREFADIAELWLLSDPYKHRAMRICGVPERFITGDASHFEKFTAWCSVVPGLIGNPLYHWSYMELQTVFGINDPICAANAQTIWAQANEKLRLPEFRAQGLLRRFGVEYASPCCAITDDLSAFADLPNLAPSLRCDGLLPPDPCMRAALTASTGVEVQDLESLKSALTICLDRFDAAGCRFADHALDHGFRFEGEAAEVLGFLASEYARRGWTMQLHMGALRDVGTRLRRIAGKAGGFAAIGSPDVPELARFLDGLDAQGALPRTILFTLNPACNEALSILSGTFSEDGVAGKVQLGAAWWWCDHISGIRETLDSVSAYSVLSTFYGMTTDSRSLLSFVRHDYFRRILCNWLSSKAEQEDIPAGFEDLAAIVRRVCYENVKKLINTR